MAKDKRVFTGGMDKDSDPRLIKNGDYRHAENIRNIASSDGTSGSVENIESTQKVNHNFKGEEEDDIIEIDGDKLSTIPVAAAYYAQEITFKHLGGNKEGWANKLQNSFDILSHTPEGSLLPIGHTWSGNGKLRWNVSEFTPTPELLWNVFNEETGTASINIPIVDLNTGEWETASSTVDFLKSDILDHETVEEVTITIIADKPGVPFLLDFSSPGDSVYWSQTIEEFPPAGKLNITGGPNDVVWSQIVLSSQSTYQSENNSTSALDSFLDSNQDTYTPPVSLEGNALTQWTLRFVGLEPTTPDEANNIKLFSYTRNSNNSIEVIPFLEFGEGLYDTGDFYEFNSNQVNISNSLFDTFNNFEEIVLHKGFESSIQGAMSFELGQVSLNFNRGEVFSADQDFDIKFTSTTDFNLCFGTSAEQVEAFLADEDPLSTKETFLSGAIDAYLILEKKEGKDLASVTDSLLDAQEEIEALTTKVSGLQGQLTDLKASYNKTLNTIQNHLPQDSTLAFTLFNELSFAKDDLDTAIDGVKNDIDNIFTAISQGLTAEQQLEISLLKNEIATLDAEILQLNNAATQAAADAIQATKDAVDAAVALINPEDGVTSADVAAVQALLDIANNKVFQLEDTIDTFNHEDGVTQADVDAVQVLLDVANTDLATAQSNVSTLTTSESSLTSQLSDKSAEVIQIQNLLDIANANQDDGITQADVDAAVAPITAVLTQAQSSISAVNPSDGLANTVVTEVQDFITTALSTLTTQQSLLDTQVGQSQLTNDIAAINNSIAAVKDEIISLQSTQEDGITQSSVDTALSNFEEILLNAATVDLVNLTSTNATTQAALDVIGSQITDANTIITNAVQGIQDDLSDAVSDLFSYEDLKAKYQEGLTNGAASVTPEDGVSQADLDAAVAAVDITTDNAQAYADGVASVTPEDGITQTDVDAAYSNGVQDGKDIITNSQVNKVVTTQAAIDAAVETAFADGAASVTPEDGVSQADVDAAVAAVDITSDNQASFDAGAASVTPEDGVSQADLDAVNDKLNAIDALIHSLPNGTTNKSILVDFINKVKNAGQLYEDTKDSFIKVYTTQLQNLINSVDITSDNATAVNDAITPITQALNDASSNLDIVVTNITGIPNGTALALIALLSEANQQITDAEDATDLAQADLDLINAQLAAAGQVVGNITVPADAITQADVDAVQSLLDTANNNIQTLNGKLIGFNSDYTNVKEQVNAAVAAAADTMYASVAAAVDTVASILQPTTGIDISNVNQAVSVVLGTIDPINGVSQAQTDSAYAAAAASITPTDGVTEAEVATALEAAVTDYSGAGTTFTSAQIKDAVRQIIVVITPEDGVTQADVSAIQNSLDSAIDTLEAAIGPNYVGDLAAIASKVSELANAQAQLNGLNALQVTETQTIGSFSEDITALQSYFNDVSNNASGLEEKIESIVDVLKGVEGSAFTETEFEGILGDQIQLLEDVASELNGSMAASVADYGAFTDSQVVTHVKTLVDSLQGLSDLKSDLDSLWSQISSYYQGDQTSPLEINSKDWNTTYASLLGIKGALITKSTNIHNISADLGIANDNYDLLDNTYNDLVEANQVTEDALSLFTENQNINNYISNGDFNDNSSAGWNGIGAFWKFNNEGLNGPANLVPAAPRPMVYTGSTALGDLPIENGSYILTINLKNLTGNPINDNGSINISIGSSDGSSYLGNFTANNAGVSTEVFDVTNAGDLEYFTVTLTHTSSQAADFKLTLDDIQIIKTPEVIVTNNFDPAIIESYILKLTSSFAAASSGIGSYLQSDLDAAYGDGYAEGAASVTPEDGVTQANVDAVEQAAAQNAQQQLKETLLNLIIKLAGRGGIYTDPSNSQYFSFVVIPQFDLYKNNTLEYFIDNVTNTELKDFIYDKIDELLADKDQVNILSDLLEDTEDSIEQQISSATSSYVSEINSLTLSNQSYLSQTQSLQTSLGSLLSSISQSLDNQISGSGGINLITEDLNLSATYGGSTGVLKDGIFVTDQNAFVSYHSVYNSDNSKIKVASYYVPFQDGDKLYDKNNNLIGIISSTQQVGNDQVINLTSNALITLSAGDNIFNHKNNALVTDTVDASIAFEVGDLIYVKVGENSVPVGFLESIANGPNYHATNNPTEKELTFKSQIEIDISDNSELLLANSITQFNEENNQNLTSLVEIINSLNEKIETLGGLSSGVETTMEAYRFTVFGTPLKIFEGGDLNRIGERRILMRNTEVPGYEDWVWDNYVVKIIDTFGDTNYTNVNIMDPIHDDHTEFSNEGNLEFNNTGTEGSALEQANRAKDSHFHYRVIPVDNGIESVLKLRFLFGDDDLVRLNSDVDGVGMNISQYGIIDVENNDVDNGYVFTVSVIRGESANKWEFVITDLFLKENLSSNREILNEVNASEDSFSGPKVQWEILETEEAFVTQEVLGPNLVEEYNSNLKYSSFYASPENSWQIASRGHGTGDYGLYEYFDASNLGLKFFGPKYVGLETVSNHVDQNYAVADESDVDDPSQSVDTELSLTVPGLKANTTYEINFPDPIENFPILDEGKNYNWGLPNATDLAALYNFNPDNENFTVLDGEYWTIEQNDSNFDLINTAIIDSSTPSHTASTLLKTEFAKVRPVAVFQNVTAIDYGHFVVGSEYNGGIVYYKGIVNSVNVLKVVALNDSTLDFTSPISLKAHDAEEARDLYFLGSLGSGVYTHNYSGSHKARWAPTVDFTTSALSAAGTQIARLKIRFHYNFRISNDKFLGQYLAPKKYHTGGSLDVKLDVTGMTNPHDVAAYFVSEINNPTVGPIGGMRDINAGDSDFGVSIYSGMGKFSTSDSTPSPALIYSKTKDQNIDGSGISYPLADYMSATNNNDGTISIIMNSKDTNYNDSTVSDDAAFYEDSDVFWPDFHNGAVAAKISLSGTDEVYQDYGQISSTGNGYPIYTPISTTRDQNKFQWQNQGYKVFYDLEPETLAGDAFGLYSGTEIYSGSHGIPDAYTASESTYNTIKSNRVNVAEDVITTFVALDEAINYYASFSQVDPNSVGSLEISLGNERQAPYNDEDNLLASIDNKIPSGTHNTFNKNLLINEQLQELNFTLDQALETPFPIPSFSKPLRLTTGPNFTGNKVFVRVPEGDGWRGRFYGLTIQEVSLSQTKVPGSAGLIKVLGEKITEGETHNVINQSPVYGTALSNAYNGGSKRLIKNAQTGATMVEPIVAGGYVCVGAYEDKPNNKVYYFTSEEEGSHKRDSIIEYDLMLDKTTTVYQDDNGSSSGDANAILTFDSGSLITGVNKIDDILYFTDNLNRPRKINVELAKKNEENIANPPYTFQDTYFRFFTSTVFVGGDNEHPFKKGDYIYTQYNTTTEDNRSYNGYAEVLGVAPKLNQGVTISINQGDTSATLSIEDHGLTSDNVGDFLSITDGFIPFYYEITSVSGTTIGLKSSYGESNKTAAKPLSINDVNVSGIITDCPWGNSVATANGKVFYANPKDAYSPLITFGEYKDKIKYFDVIKHQPTNKPYIEMFKDSGVASNNLINDTFQFKYRYTHRDNENTAYGPISGIAIDPAYASNAAVSAIDFNLLNNAIKVEYEDAICDVEQIEIVARKGNKGEFFLVDSIPNNFISYLKLAKNNFISDSKYQFKVESNYLDFYNNGTYPFIDRNDSTKLFDAVPVLAKAQAILSNNRLAYGNIVEGYDNTDVAMDVSFSAEEAPVLEETIYDIPWTSTLDDFESNSSTFKQGGNGGRAQLDVAIDCNAVPLAGNKSQFVEINFWMTFHFRRSAETWLYTPPTWSTAASFNLQVDVTGAEDGEALASFLIGEINSGNFRGGMYGGKGFMNVSNTNNRGTVTATSNSPGVVNLRIISANQNKPRDFGTLFDKRFVWSPSRTIAGTLRSGTLGTATFKSGAHHNFGIAYFDETNRCSFVNTGASFGATNYSEDIGYYISGSKGYAPFYTESNGPALGQGTNASINIYNKAPEWAKSYQLYYTGNTTVDEFIQMTVTDVRAGSSANGDDQVYLSLNSLKGKNWSYNQTNNSNIGYNFVPGDRIRFISCVSGGSRRKFAQYIDLEIAGEDLFQGSGNSIDQEGYYIRISDPVNDAVGIEGATPGTQDTVDLSVSNLRGNLSTAGYNQLIVEIYRPKRTKEEDTMVYYEIGDKYPIKDGYHIGDSTQAGEFLYNDTLGFEVSSDPATIPLKTGDIYMKSRAMFSDGTANAEDPIIFFPEDYYLNDFHVTNSYSIGRINVVNRNSKARRLDASVYYSETYSSTGSINGLSSFNLAMQPYFDYNKEFGSIQSLQTKDDDLIIFHENKVGRVLVGKDILNTASGDGLVSLSRDVLKNYVTVYSGEYGCCLQPESIVKANDRFYFMDIKKGAVLRLSNDGITPISDNGMKDYFRDIGEMYVEYNPESQDNQVFNIVAGFDPKYNEYIITLPAVYDNSDGSWDSESVTWDDDSDAFNLSSPNKVFYAKTIAFNEDIDRWTSFYGFHPEFYARINNQFIGFQAGYMFKHNMTDKYYQDLYVNNSDRSKSNPNYNQIYNNFLDSSITFPFNAEPGSVKNYNAISLESDTKFFTEVSTNIGQTARGENNIKGYENVMSTDIGFRKVKGNIDSTNGSYIVGNSNPSNGEVTKFYEDINKGDVIRIYANPSTDSSVYSYYYDVVRKVSSNSLLLLSKSFDLSDISHIEVIDYKTKEGVQYAQIPFVSSELGLEDSYQTDDYTGDGSELSFLGLISSASSTDDGVTFNFNLNTTEDLGYLNKSVSVNNMITGAKYILLDRGSDQFKVSEFGSSYPGSIKKEFSNVPGEAFICSKDCNLSKSKVAPVDYKVYAQDLETGQVNLLGYMASVSKDNKVLISCLIGGSAFIESSISNGGLKFGLFLAKDGKVEGERLKGSYMMTTLSTKSPLSTSTSSLAKYKFNLYSASVDVDKSELSGE